MITKVVVTSKLDKTHRTIVAECALPIAPPLPGQLQEAYWVNDFDGTPQEASDLAHQIASDLVTNGDYVGIKEPVADQWTDSIYYPTKLSSRQPGGGGPHPRWHIDDPHDEGSI